MHVVLATVTRKVIDSSCYSVVLPTVTGQIEVLEGHVGLLTQLATGVLRIKKSAEDAGESLVVQGGFAQVANNQLNIVTEVAEKPTEIDVAAAKAAIATTEQSLRTGGLSPEKIAAHYNQLRLHQARMTVAAKQ